MRTATMASPGTDRPGASCKTAQRTIQLAMVCTPVPLAPFFFTSFLIRSIHPSIHPSIPSVIVISFHSHAARDPGAFVVGRAARRRKTRRKRRAGGRAGLGLPGLDGWMDGRTGRRGRGGRTVGRGREACGHEMTMSTYKMGEALYLALWRRHLRG